MVNAGPRPNPRAVFRVVTYLTASGIFARLDRTQGLPVRAQLEHEGLWSSQRIFWLRHRAHAVPFFRPGPEAGGAGGCCMASDGSVGTTPGSHLDLSLGSASIKEGTLLG